MSALGTVLLVLVLLLLMGVNPGFAHAASWGWGPSGLLGIVFVVVLVLAVTGRL